MRPVLTLALVLTASAAAGQVPAGPDIEGTWELTASENVPYESELVFGRMTFTVDEVRSVFVFLDPDDAELDGRVHRDRYIVSDGQLVVRDLQSTTVLDVERDGAELTVRDVQTGVVFRMRAADPALALDPDLVGAWEGVLGTEEATLTFSPDGDVEVAEADGDRETKAYVVAGPYLLIGDDAFRYSFGRGDQGKRLILGSGPERRDFLRVSH